MAVRVDFKHSIWTEEKELWDELAPGILAIAEHAFYGEAEPLTIYSRPKHGDRSATIIINEYQASVDMRTHWEPLEVLASRSVPDRYVDLAVDELFNWFMDKGILEGDETIGARLSDQMEDVDFKEFLRWVTKAEARLLRQESANSKELQQELKRLREMYNEETGEWERGDRQYHSQKDDRASDAAQSEHEGW